MTDFITDSTLIGLHDHKAGQYGSLKKVTAIHALALVVVAVLSLVIGFSRDSGGHAPGVLFIHSPPTSSGALPLSGSIDFPTGYIGKIRVVPPPCELDFPLPKPPGPGFLFLPVPGVNDFPPSGGIGVVPDRMSTNSDFGLPDPPPLWTYTSRGLPPTNADMDISLPTIDRQPHAMLVDPTWPDNVWLVDDTAVVDGILTMHSYGLMSFELVSETPIRAGFGLAVKRAVEQGQCIPARDLDGNRMTVRCRYRVLFFHGGKPSISVGVAVTARVRKDPLQ